MKRKKLLDVYSNPYNNGIIYALYNSNNGNVISLFNKLGVTTDNVHSMDIDYYYNRSGFKSISTMLEFMVSGLVVEDNGILVTTRNNELVAWDYVLSEINIRIINDIIITKFLSRWNKLADTLLTDYNPLTPYNMEITTQSKRQLNSAQNGSRSSNDNSLNTSSSDLTETPRVVTTTNNNDNIFGFNSANSVPSNNSDSEISYSGSNTSESSNTQNLKREVTGSNNNEYKSDELRDGSITRSGNIGNQSAMELIDKERNTALYQIWEVIYNDLDSILTRSKYCD